MPKTYAAPAAFNDPNEYIEIDLHPVSSSQVKAVGYDASTRTLSVTFAHGIGSIYQYPDVSPETHAAFIGAESIGKYFGQHIKALPFKKFRAPALA